MPYTITDTADGCSGWAVVKEGSNTPIPGGCHTSRTDALAHMVAVEAAYQDTEAASAISERDGEENLIPRQKMLYGVLEAISETFGQFSQDNSPNGCGYKAESPYKSEGIMCGNCVFYEEGICEIVAGEIAMEGLCRFWVIPSSSETETVPVVVVEAEEEDGDEAEVDDEMEYESRQINLVAPGFMRASARRGLALHEEGESGGGLRPQTVEDAREMANGDALSEQKWRKIGPWIARHIVDLDAVQGNEITPGLVAMLLWGGGSSKASARRAQDYAERLVARLDEQTAE
jgi:hypothetical protein